MTGGPRSYDNFADGDLAYLADVASRSLLRFVARHPKHRTLPDRLMCMLLCQGGALHYIDGRNGVKDLDVWSFFRDDGHSPQFPYRRREEVPYERANFQNSLRKIDILGRTLATSPGSDPIVLVQNYLASGKTETAKCLAEKAAVVLLPVQRQGEVIWPVRP